MLSEFSPVPGTPDGDACRAYTDLDEPLNHNKTAFTMRFLGADRVNHFKDLCRAVNNTVVSNPKHAGIKPAATGHIAT